MKKLLLLLTLCLIAFTGCKEKKEDYAALLVGTWADQEADEQLFTKFNNDGTGEQWFVYKGEKEEAMHFKYNYDTNKGTITVIYTDTDTDEIPVMTVVELNKTKLVLKFEGDEEQITLYRQ